MWKSDWSLDINQSKSDNDNNWSTFNSDSDNKLKFTQIDNKHEKDSKRSKFFNNNVRSFGDHVDNYDWVKCKSKSIPGKTYYFNLRSGCSTWYRPISRYIDIPYYSKKMSLKKIQCYLSSPSLLVSDSYNEVSSLSIKLKKENHHKKWILEEPCSTSKSNKNSNFARFSSRECINDNERKTLSNNSQSNDTYYYNDDNHLPIKNEMNYNDSDLNNDSIIINNDSTFIDVTNYLQCELSSEDNDIEVTSVELNSTKMKLKIKNNDIDINADRTKELSENDVNEKNEYVDVRETRRRLASHLRNNINHRKDISSSKRIKLKRDQRKTMRKIVLRTNDSTDNNKMLMRKPERIICNMYGVTTVNYDEVSELPPNVKRSNLSDSTSIVSSSTSSSFSTTEENRSRSSILKCFLGHDDLYDNILPPKLSDSNSSTSSSSWTCDTCSSCSCTQSDSTKV
ncbi:uncharacterized protein DDB_G0283697-like isoform X2 [Vespa crabro]|uniref:uncharacterized protein DDB_G0283697-like isoform X2 n=1 Tax=Vespa crabro TaxID=7445 RepID=UPI001F00BD02|nr:uncharacterized protein DDB_G0283697-like isoform X2 [Vespa crabro]